MDLFTKQEAKQALLQLISSVMDNNPTGAEVTACIKLAGVFPSDVKDQVMGMLEPFKCN